MGNLFTTHHSNFASGVLLGRRYEVVRILGSGTLGTTYLVRDRDLGSARVALKVLHPGAFEDEEALAAIRQAVAQIRQLSHPHICRCYDFIQLSKGVWGIAFEYVAGVTLAEVIRRSKSQPLRADEALFISTYTGRALHFAHTLGVIHGNLHPANILLGKNGLLKVTDFFLNSAVPTQIGLTRSRTLLGVPRYLPPEQIAGTAATAASDVFSLAALTLELLAGSERDDKSGFTAQLQRQMRLQLADFGELPHEVSPELRQQLELALNPNPALRSVTAGEIADGAQVSLSSRLGEEILPGRGASVLSARFIAESDLRRFRPLRALIVCILLSFVVASFGQENVKRNLFATVLLLERDLKVSLAPVYERFGVPDVSYGTPDRIARAIEYPKQWLFWSVALTSDDYARPDKNGETPLGIIARKTFASVWDYGDNSRIAAEVLEILDYDPIVDGEGRDRLLLHRSVEQGDLQFIESLSSRFPKLLWIRDNQGRQPLDLAAQLGARDVLQILLRNPRARCEIDLQSGRSAYHWAAAAGAVSSLVELENAKCDTELRDRSGDTPLMLALRFAPPATVHAAARHLRVAQSTDSVVLSLAAERGISISAEPLAAPIP